MAAFPDFVQKQVLVQAVCLTQLTFHAVPVHSVLEMTLGNGYQHLHRRNGGGTRNGGLILANGIFHGHKDSPERVGRHGFVSAAEQGFYEFLAAQTLRLVEGVTAHRLRHSLA